MRYDWEWETETHKYTMSEPIENLQDLGSWNFFIDVYYKGTRTNVSYKFEAPRWLRTIMRSSFIIQFIKGYKK